MLPLETKINQLNKVGKALSLRLRRLKIETVGDLIFYFPFRYDDYSRLVKIKELQPNDNVTVSGRIDLIAGRRSRYKRKILAEALLSDETGSVKIIWFNQPWIAKSIKVGEKLTISGKVSGDFLNPYFNSPNYERLGERAPVASGLLPVYSLTEGLTQKQLRFLIKSALSLSGKLEDYLPLDLAAREGLPSLDEAVKIVHQPLSNQPLKTARNRLAFDEIFFLQLWSKIIKRRLSKLAAKPIKFFIDETKDFINSLSFKLTTDQKKAAWEIIKDLGKDRPMNRLLEGDVGSGKTLVAIIAMYNVALNGAQSALMAPTDILARQHYQTISGLLATRKIGIGILTRTQKLFNGEKVTDQEFQHKLKSGEIKIIIGTHALIQKNVVFKDLALVVVDEQHRFGVIQRQELQKKSDLAPHFLALTATPIPRSLALVLYGDLDLSIIKELPQDRKKIITRLVPAMKRRLAYDFITKQITMSRQVFVICPLIDPSDKLGVKSVKEEFEKLDKDIFLKWPVAMLHGKMKPAEKEEVMRKFNNNEISILISTSVVEVGIDVPNATVMMIEGSDRFGLSQLHQFRGRVGRGQHQSYCFLFTDNDSDNVNKRLNYLAECQDGFALANRDLELRGTGNIYGYEQSGFFSLLKMADLSDLNLIKKAATAAEYFLDNYQLDDYPQIKDKLSVFEELERLE